MKATKIVILILFLVIDVIVIPVLLSILIAVKQVGISGMSLWLKHFNLLHSLSMVLKNPPMIKVWLLCQPILIFAYIYLFWINRFDRNKRLGDIGGPQEKGNGEFGTSRWLTELEMKQLTTPWKFRKKDSPERGGVIIGTNEKHDTAFIDAEDSHTLLVATTRAGKSRKVIMPTIWEIARAGESMILTDPKGELYERSKTYLKKMGYNVVLLDFRDPSRGNHWNPLYKAIEAVEKGDHSLASEIAWDIAHMFAGQTQSTGETIWRDGAESTLAALILAVIYEAENDNQKHMTSVYRLLIELGGTVNTPVGPIVPLNEYMDSLPMGHPARSAFGTAKLAPARTRGSFFTSSSAYLRLFSDPNLAYLTSRQDHDLEQVGEKKTAVFLVIPDEKSTRNIFASLYLDQTYAALVKLAIEKNGRLPVRVHYLLDEFGNMPPINDFAKKITVSAGRGMRYMLAVQDLQQLNDIYGKSAKTITGNCHTWLYLLTTDFQTAKEFSSKTGTYTIGTESMSTSLKHDGYHSNISQSQGLTGRPLLNPDEILRFPENRVLVIKARNNPANLYLPDLSLWPANDDLTISGGDIRKNIEETPVFIPEITQKPKNNKGDQKKNEKEEIKEDPNKEEKEELQAETESTTKSIDRNTYDYEEDQEESILDQVK